MLTRFFADEARGRLCSILLIYSNELNRCAGVQRQVRDFESKLSGSEAFELALDFSTEKLAKLRDLIDILDTHANNTLFSENKEFSRLTAWISQEMHLTEIESAKTQLNDCIKIINVRFREEKEKVAEQERKVLVAKQELADKIQAFNAIILLHLPDIEKCKGVACQINDVKLKISSESVTPFILQEYTRDKLHQLRTLISSLENLKAKTAGFDVSVSSDLIFWFFNEMNLRDLDIAASKLEKHAQEINSAIEREIKNRAESDRTGRILAKLGVK